MLIFERLSLFFFFFEQAIGRFHDEPIDCAMVFNWNEAEFVRALAPIEDMGIPRRLAPIDERAVRKLSRTLR
jgi:hypothetical protein